MPKTILLTQEFVESLDGLATGERLNETVLNRPLAQLGNNTLWLKAQHLQLKNTVDALSTATVDYNTLDTRYELKVSKKTAFNLDLATQAEIDSGTVTNKLTAANHNHDTKYELKITNKLSAFNKNFGTVAGTVTEGNDPRLSDARNPLTHRHDLSILNSNGAIATDVLSYDGLKWAPMSKQALAALLIPLWPPAPVQNGSGGTISSVPWGIVANTPTTLAGYGITDAITPTQVDDKISTAIASIAPATGQSANTGIFVTKYTAAAGQTTFPLPDSNAVFRVTMNGIDLESASYSRVNSTLTIPGAVAESIVIAYQQGAQAGLLRQEFTATTNGTQNFALNNNGPVYSISINGLDVEQATWTQSGTNLSINGLNSGDVIITLRTRGF